MSAARLLSADAQSERAYRDALGRFATGIAIVSVVTDSGPLGMTINSFSSVSLDPPLVLWCLAKSSNRRAAFGKADRFAISVLQESQHSLAQQFARHGQSFSADNSVRNDAGLPFVRDALAWFECRYETSIEAGDHDVVLGRVLAFAESSGKPLIYQGGRFGTLSA